MTNFKIPPEKAENALHASKVEPDVLAALRAATRDRHAWLDANVPLAAENPGAGDYVKHLQLVGGWLQLAAPLLQNLRAAGADIGDGGLQSIREDLAESGVVLPPVDAAGATACKTPEHARAQSRTNAFSWGVAYVAEGSRLGGQVMFKRLAEPLSPLSLAYLRGRGAETGAHWREFLQALRASVIQPEDVEAACAGAVWSFDTLIDYYRKAPNPQ